MSYVATKGRKSLAISLGFACLTSLTISVAAWADAPPAAPVVTAPAATAPVAPADKALGRKVPNFTADLIDVSKTPPSETKFDSSQQKKVTAYIFVGTMCP